MEKESEKKFKNDKKLTIYTVILAVLVVILITLSLILKLKQDKNEKSVTSEGVADENIVEIVDELKEKNERERIEYYATAFFNFIEDGKYDEAYKVLNEKFRKNYFPSFDDFKIYCEKTFPDMMNIKYENIERNGDIYVQWIQFSDMINGNKNDEREIKVVITENDFYDFELSFSII